MHITNCPFISPPSIGIYVQYISLHADFQYEALGDLLV